MRFGLIAIEIAVLAVVANLTAFVSDCNTDKKKDVMRLRMKSLNSLLVGPVVYLGMAIVTICGGVSLVAYPVLASEEKESRETSVSRSMTFQTCLSSFSTSQVVEQQSTLLDFARELSEEAGNKKRINPLILSEIINVGTQVDGFTTVTLQLRGHQKPEKFKLKTEILLVSPAEMHAKNSEIIGLQQENRDLQQQLAELQQQHPLRMRVSNASLSALQSAPGSDASSSVSSAIPEVSGSSERDDSTETLSSFHSDIAGIDPLYYYPHRSRPGFLERIKGNKEEEESRSPKLSTRGIVTSKSQGNLHSAHGAETDTRSPKSAPTIGSPKHITSESLFNHPSLSRRGASSGGSPKAAPTTGSKGVSELSPRLVSAASSPRVMTADGTSSGSFSKFLNSSAYPFNFKLGGKADDSEPSSPVLARSMSTTSVSSTSSGSTLSTRSSTSSISARAGAPVEQAKRQSDAGGSSSGF